MNIYSCWHKGTLGYCCRRHNAAWMFVPELGQYDNNIYKNVAFEDLIFRNKYESDYEARLERSRTAGLLQKILRKKFRAHTIGGLLFCAADI